MDPNIAVDLPLDERRVHAKFGRSDSYGVQIQKGTERQTDFRLYILDNGVATLTMCVRGVGGLEGGARRR